jgi:regulator of protease activity HflC (stomatin/prohibitin superfamily)
VYVKVFQKILDSSIAEDWYVRHVFEDFLKLADRDGVVDMTAEAFCRRTNAPELQIVRRSIEKLSAPDPTSRSATDDGRRIELLDDHRDWGWRILNYRKYRNLKTPQELREATAERVRRHREKKEKAKAEAEAEGNAVTPDVTHVTRRAFTPPTIEEVSAYVREKQLRIEPEKFIDHYEANGWKRGKTPIVSWKAAARIWSRNEKPTTKDPYAGMPKL